MLTIRARNVNEAYPLALQIVANLAVERQSRNGPVLMLQEPLSIHYQYPLERVLFDPARDANPFFHFMESLWMLGGRRDVKWIANYLPRMADFSDDGVIFNGAYGHRWRLWFGHDQLHMITSQLQRDPASRRCVLQMWDARYDLGLASKDLPCNISATFQIDDSKLNMTVFNRSNDLILGALGANVVHFSTLQQYMADAIGVEIGWYEQVTANAHVYKSEWSKRGYDLQSFFSSPMACPYQRGEVEPWGKLWVNKANWMQDLTWFLLGTQPRDFSTMYFREVVMPMTLAYRAYKVRDFTSALRWITQCAASDWRLASIRWLERREHVAALPA